MEYFICGAKSNIDLFCFLYVFQDKNMHHLFFDPSFYLARQDKLNFVGLITDLLPPML